MQIWQQILIAMVLGFIAGMLLGEDAEYLKPLGTLFIRLISMLVVPLVFFSLISGVTSLNDPITMGRVGLKAMGAYLLTTMFAITIGLCVGYVSNAGEGIKIEFDSNKVEKVAPPTIAETLSGIVPSNPFESLASGNILQVIFFALVFGIAASLISEKAQPFIKLNHALAEIMYRMTGIVMLYAPIGVFGLMAWMAGTQGLAVIMPLIKLAAAFLVGVAIHIFFVYGMGIFLLLKLNLRHFFISMLDIQAVAFSTSSSSATLPVTIKTAREKLGVSESTAGFVLPLGATINMDGTALYQGIVVMFVAQAVGVDLTTGDLVTVVLASTLASIGTAGIPSGGLIMLSLVLASVGLPLEAIAIIAGIDRLLDMVRTVVNVTGDCFVALVVDKTEGSLDTGKYLL